MTPLEVLIKARRRIESVERFTRGSFARTDTGRSAGPTEPEACQWCAYGAIQSFQPGCEEEGPYLLDLPEFEVAELALRDACEALYNEGVVNVNDFGPNGDEKKNRVPIEESHRLILAAYDEAIRRLS